MKALPHLTEAHQFWVEIEESMTKDLDRVLKKGMETRGDIEGEEAVDLMEEFDTGMQESQGQGQRLAICCTSRNQ